MKLISVILVLLLLFSVSAFAADGSSSTLSFTALNPDSFSKQAEIKIAVYDEEGRIVSITKKEITPAQEIPIQINDYLTKENKGTTLKAFFIDDELNPYTTSDTLGISTLSLETPVLSSGTAEILWANKFTMALQITADSPQAILVHVPDSWEVGATYTMGTEGGIAPIVKETNGKRYVSVPAKSGKLILQKRIGFPITYLSDPTITTFYENKDAAVSVTFDDGDYNSAVFYNSEFEKYGFRGTAFLISNRLSGINNWKQLLAKGYVDVGNHSASHQLNTVPMKKHLQHNS